MRKDIFGLGALQVGLVRGAADWCRHRRRASPLPNPFVAGAGFVLTSTAIVMQLLEERGEIARVAAGPAPSVLDPAA